MSNGMITANGSLPRESQTDSCPSPRSLATCVSSLSPVQLDSTEGLRKWLQQVSRASHSALPENKPAQTTSEICGPPLSTASARYDPDSRSWRTFQDSLIPGISAQSWETWPKAGMTLDGVFYRRQSWERRISEIGYGLLPTPTMHDSTRRTQFNPVITRNGTIRHKNKAGGQSRASLSQIVNMWPTPNLRTAVTMYPTPSATDATKWSNQTAKERKEKGQSVRLPHALKAGGQLNPDWTAWLMGWPIGWEDLKPLAMDKFRLWWLKHGGG